MEKPKEPKPKPWFQQIKISSSQLFSILAIAVVMATLFTAWTPGSSSGDQVPFREIARIPTRIPEDSSQGSGETAVDEKSSELISNRIGIVAGHWGSDSGAVCANGVTEADINLEVASSVQKALKVQGYQVDLLEEFDTNLWKYRARALVSIHADSCDYINNLATGFKVAASMANPNPESSAALTSCLRSRYGQVTGLPVHSLSVTPDMTSYHAFREIDETTTAAIIEIGFLNLDYEFLTKQTDLVVQGITEGILCFLNNEEVNIPQSDGQP